MNYGAIIEKAARMVLRHPYLWLLGFLGGGEAFSAPTGFPGSFGGPVPTGGVRSNVFYFGPSPAPSWAPLTAQGNSVDFGTFFSDHPGAAAAIVVGILLAFVLGALWFFFLGPVSTGGLVRAAVEHDDERTYNFGQAWRAGLKTFWRVLGLRLLEIVFLLFVLGILGIFALISFAASGFSVGSFGSFGLVFLLIFLVSIATQVVVTLAVRAVVLDDRTITHAIESAIALVRRRPGPVALVWVISVAISIGIAIAVFVVLAIIAIPFVLLGFITYAAGAGIAIPLVLGILLGLAIIIVAASASGAYTSVLWTLAYRRFDGEPAATAATPAA
jgi:hypothetical protein